MKKFLMAMAMVSVLGGASGAAQAIGFLCPKPPYLDIGGSDINLAYNWNSDSGFNVVYGTDIELSSVPRVIRCRFGSRVRSEPLQLTTGDQDFFKITVAANVWPTVYTQGPKAHIDFFDEQGNMLDNFHYPPPEGPNAFWNGVLVYEMVTSFSRHTDLNESKVYYVRVRGFTSTDTGNYRILLVGK